MIVDKFRQPQAPQGAVRAWLDRAPRCGIHQTPKSIFWLNAAEGYCAELTVIETWHDPNLRHSAGAERSGKARPVGFALAG
jgi:hypothetical protein